MGLSRYILWLICFLLPIYQTAADAHPLVKAVQTAMTAHQGSWQKTKNKHKHQLTWLNTEMDKRKQLHFSLLETAQADQYILTLTLDLEL